MKPEKPITNSRQKGSSHVAFSGKSFETEALTVMLSAFAVLGLLDIIWSLNAVTSSFQTLLNNITSGFIFLFSVLGLFGLIRKNSFLVYLSLLAPITILVSTIQLLFTHVKTFSYTLSSASETLILALSVICIYTSYKTISRSQIPQNIVTEYEQKTESEYTVELIDVVKIYKVGPIEVPALNGVNLKVKKGEFVAIMGPSGSGKSTLLNLIGALDRPTSGKVIIDGVDISTLSDDELAKLRNKKIGFVFQAYNLINRSKVLRNVELPALIGGMPKKERVKKAIHLLKTLGLGDTIHRKPKTLSGGQQQRVAIARAVINDPDIILADEPTGNLDSKSGREVMMYLRKMNKELGTTVIVVTHDREIAEMADRIIHIKDGKIVGEEVLRRNRT